MASQCNEDLMFDIIEVKEGGNEENRDESNIENLDFCCDDSDDKPHRDTKKKDEDNFIWNHQNIGKTSWQKEITAKILLVTQT